MSEKPLTLIQLVSEQTVQNLLPVLRLRPDRLVHLAAPRTVHRSSLIAEAARQSNRPVELETVALSAMPGMQETMQATLRAIEDAAQRDTACLVNFTGGTKLMSIGAYVAALKYKTPSIYVDTQDAVFVDGRTGEGLDALLDGDWSFTPIQRRITVNAIAVANGCARVTEGRDWRPWLPLANHLYQNPADEDRCHEVINGPRNQPPVLGFPRRAAEWLAALDTDIPLPPAVAELAVQSGRFRPGTAPNTVRLPDATRDKLAALSRLDGAEKVPAFARRLFTAVAPLQDALNFLGGAWWEVIVAERMKQCGRFRDIRWSAKVGKRESELEEDVLAIEGVQIVYVSCKRGGERSRFLPLLEEIQARARSLGGVYNRRFLAVYKPPSARVLSSLKRRADELGVKILFPEDLERLESFD